MNLHAPALGSIVLHGSATRYTSDVKNLKLLNSDTIRLKAPNHKNIQLQELSSIWLKNSRIQNLKRTPNISVRLGQQTLSL